MKICLNFFLFFLLVVSIVCSCGEDFDEKTDSALQSISVSVHPQDWYDEILIMTTSGCEKKIIPLITDEDHLLRVTGYCYNSNDSLLSTSEIVSKAKEDVVLTFRRVPITEYCHIVVLADLVRKRSATSYEENWSYLNRRNYSELSVLSMGTSESSEYNALYVSHVDAIPNNQQIELNMQKVSYHGFFRIISHSQCNELYGSIKYPNRFSAKTLQNTTMQGYEFSAPYQFEGELLFPVTAIGFGEELSVSYSAEYKYNNIVVHNHKVANKDYRPFFLTIDCTENSKTPIDFKTF